MWRLHIKRTLLFLSVLLLTTQLVSKWSRDDKEAEAMDKHSAAFWDESSVHGYDAAFSPNAVESQGLGPLNLQQEPALFGEELDVSDQVQHIRRPCNLPLLRPDLVPDLQTWQKVGDPSTYVFSAYYDTRSHLPVVRVIAVATNYMGGTRFCQVWFKHHRQAQVVPAEVGPIPETHGRRYAAMFLLCYLPGRTPDIPVAVSVVRTQCETATNLLPVYYTLTPDTPIYNFTVCVTPLNRYYDNVNQMTEMVEVNRMFGAEKFIFYNHSSGHKVQSLMESYMKDGLLEVVPWDLPLKTETSPPTPGVEIHYFAQLAALNDCLYKNIYKSRYIVFSDLDEIIVPRAHETWDQLLVELKESHDLQRTTSFLFRCVFFKTEWPDDDVMAQHHKVKVLRPLTLLKTKRERKVWMAGMRSKYIAVPGRLDTVGVHTVLKYHTGHGTEDDLVVPEQLGLLHHYRFWDDPRDTNWLVDKSMHRFAGNIIRNMDRWRKSTDSVQLR